MSKNESLDEMIVDNGLYYTQLNKFLDEIEYVNACQTISSLILVRMRNLDNIILSKKDLAELLNYFEESEIYKDYSSIPFRNICEMYDMVDLYGVHKKSLCNHKGDSVKSSLCKLMNDILEYISNEPINKNGIKQIIAWQSADYQLYEDWSIVIDLLHWINNFLKYFTKIERNEED